MLNSKLRGKIREKFGSERAFAQAIGMAKQTLSNKLNGKTEWTLGEMKRAKELLDIETQQFYYYFFAQ